MSNDMNFTFVHSKESEIDKVLEELIGKLVSDGLTPQEAALFEELLAQRSRLMRPMGMYRPRDEQRLNAA
jgi:hypothetical protein